MVVHILENNELISKRTEEEGLHSVNTIQRKKMYAFVVSGYHTFIQYIFQTTFVLEQIL